MNNRTTISSSNAIGLAAVVVVYLLAARTFSGDVWLALAAFVVLSTLVGGVLGEISRGKKEASHQRATRRDAHSFH